MSTEAIKIIQYPDGRVDTENAARYLGLAAKTLAMMRVRGHGPRYVKWGRIFYYLNDLDAWLREGLVMTNESLNTSR